MKINSSEYNQQFTILTVDDVPKNVQILGTILKKENYQVSFATSGKQALSIIESEKPDLILLDIMMPEMDGYQVAQILKNNKETKDIPIIFLTAKTETEDIIKGFEVGCVDYVTKPFNTAELLARVRTHLELKKAREELIKLNATNSKFFSIMSRDIRNALVGVKGIAQFLLEDIELDNKDNIPKMARIMHNDSSKLFDLLENIVEWSNINSDIVENKPQRCNLKDTVKNVFTSLQVQAKKKNVSLVEEIDKNHFVFIDLHMLKTILFNIIYNGVKYSKPDGGEVKVVSEDKNNFIKISVSDKGVGIPEERIENLFNIDSPFQKTIGTANEVGTGLGLIICKALIEKNGSEIRADSRIHRGTTFTFTLPTKEKI